MKKNYTKIILLILLSTFIVLTFPNLTRAFDRRVGDFRLKFAGSESWFGKKRVFVPGETKKKDFWAYNYSQKEQPLYFIAFGRGKDSQLAKNFIINFYQGSRHIFKKRLIDLRSSSYNQESLGLIGPGQTQKYTCTVYLKKQLGNNYQGSKTGSIAFALGYGGYGSKPEVVIPVFGYTTSETGGETGGEVRGKKKGTEKPEGIELEEPENGEVKGDQGAAVSRCGTMDWLIIVLIIVILALIIWRYLVRRRQREDT